MITTLSSRGEMDITIDFGSIIPGSNPGESIKFCFMLSQYGACAPYGRIRTPERCRASTRDREAVPRPRFAAAHREPRESPGDKKLPLIISAV